MLQPSTHRLPCRIGGVHFERALPYMSSRVASAILAGRPNDGARLYAILYISTAARLLSADELDRLCRSAQARNLQEDVTGVLLYSDGAFMQYLEGPAGGLARIYGVIKADPLHYGVIDLLREPIQGREFAAWSMAFRAVGGQGRSSTAEPDDLLLEGPGTDGTPRVAARELLLGFWTRGRCSVGPILLDFSADRAERLAKAVAT
jgi:hypothetical protein